MLAYICLNLPKFMQKHFSVPVVKEERLFSSDMWQLKTTDKCQDSQKWTSGSISATLHRSRALSSIQHTIAHLTSRYCEFSPFHFVNCTSDEACDRRNVAINSQEENLLL